MAKKKIELKKLGLRKRDIEAGDFEKFSVEFDTPSTGAIIGFRAALAGAISGQSDAGDVLGNFLLRHLKSWTLEFALQKESINGLPDAVLDALAGAVVGAGDEAGN
jgi:hypothetical protein